MTRKVLLATFLGLVTACGGGASGTCTSTDVPTACPASGAPSYATAVAPVLTAQCTGCHDFGNYAAASSRKSAILSRVGNCSMPQGGTLTSADRATVLDWAVCGAPNN